MEQVPTPPHARAPAWSPPTIVAVALGGAIGAGLRWAIGVAMTHQAGDWPWPTLVVNVVGCAAIGAAARGLRVGTVAWAFVVTGVLGGFTTFSSFSLEVDQLLEADRPTVAVTYVVVTIVAGVAATWLAYREPAP